MKLVVTTYADFVTALGAVTELAMFHRVAGGTIEEAVALFEGGAIYLPRAVDSPATATFTTAFASSVALSRPFFVYPGK